jgi:membrane protein insertase Oxa1/YidC/SpoIIIJ
MLWTNLIDILRGSLFVLAHWCGGSFGAAILIASSLARVAMFPVTLAATRRRLTREQKLRELAPELEVLKRQYAGKPDLLLAATQKLHTANGISMLDRRMLVEALMSFPPAAALYSAIRGAGDRAGGFLWVNDLAKPDRILTVAASVIAGLIAGALASAFGSAPAAKGVAQFLPVLATTAITFLMLSHLSAGLALYSVANSIVGAVERVIAERTLQSSVA